MINPLCVLVAVLAIGPPTVVSAEALVAARMIRSQTVLVPSDLAVRQEQIPGALRDASAAVGLEARVNIYAGRPIRAQDLGAPAIIERNQIVVLNYYHAGLSIVTEGRALGRAGPGERIRVMNTESRGTVTGTVLADGSVSFAPSSR